MRTPGLPRTRTPGRASRSLWVPGAVSLVAMVLAAGWAVAFPSPALPSSVSPHSAPPDAVQSAGAETFRTFFSLRSARRNDSIPAAVRAELARLEKETPKPGEPPSAPAILLSVEIDLNGDGRPERFVAHKTGRPVSGTPWVIMGAGGEVLGPLTGGLIFVRTAPAGSWPSLETFWQTSAETAVVGIYTFSNGHYVKTSAQALTLPEIDEYFSAKPPLGRELEDFKELIQ